MSGPLLPSDSWWCAELVRKDEDVARRDRNSDDLLRAFAPLLLHCSAYAEQRLRLPTALMEELDVLQVPLVLAAHAG